MTRTSRARIRPFTRICGCSLNQSPKRRGRESAPSRRISLSHFAIAREHSSSSRLRSSAMNGAQFREPDASTKQQLCAGKANLREMNMSILQQIRGAQAAGLWCSAARRTRVIPASRRNLHASCLRSPATRNHGGGSPKCALCAAYCTPSSSSESIVAAIGSSLTTPEKTARSPVVGIDDEGGTLRHLQRMKFTCRSSHAFLNVFRLCALE